MSAYMWAMGIIALLACAGAVYVIIEHPVLFPVKHAPSLSMLVPSSLEVGKSFDVQVEADYHARETVTLTLGTNTYPHDCTEDVCTFTIPLTIDTPGEYTLFLQSPLQYAQLPIHVSLKTAVCLDGTLEGACATHSLPLRCVNHTLVDDCSICGCEKGFVCQTNACVAPSFSFTISLQPPSAFYTTAATPVSVTLTNASAFSVTGLFLIDIDAWNASGELIKTIPQQVQLTNVEAQGAYNVSIPVQLSPNTHHISARLFHSTDAVAEDQLIETSAPLNVTVQSDVTPPSPPSSLSYHAEANGYTLAWGASSSADVSGYVIYQQNLATGGFTTYSILAQVGGLSYSLPPDAQGKAYAVKAQDAAGNESTATTPVFIS